MHYLRTLHIDRRDAVGHLSDLQRNMSFNLERNNISFAALEGLLSPMRYETVFFIFKKYNDVYNSQIVVGKHEIR